MTRPIVSPKTSGAEAKGRLQKKLWNLPIMFGFGHSLVRVKGPPPERKETK